MSLEIRKGQKIWPSVSEIQPSVDQEPTKKSKASKGQQKKGSTEGSGFEAAVDHRSKVSTWSPLLMLDGAPLPSDSSIGKVDYVANSLEQALLFPRDMADLRSLKKHKVFLTLKRELAPVSFHIHTPNYIFTLFFLLKKKKKKNLVG